jgi:hypothetical protein
VGGVQVATGLTDYQVILHILQCIMHNS